MILITAPTGDIGGQVVADLLATTDEPLRVVVRDPARLSPDVRDRVEVVTGSHGDPAVLEEALAGVDAVFWVAPPSATQPMERTYTGFTRPAAEAFARLGVTHVVGVSALGRTTPYADRAGLVTASLAMDDLIAGSGVAYRALACPSFMDNWLRDLDDIRAGVVRGPLDADRPAPSAATADIAATGARLLADRSWTGSGEAPVLGPEDLTQDDMARIIGEVVGHPVRYEQIPFDAVREQMLGFGLDPDAVDGMVTMMEAKNQGLDNGVARTPENTTPTTFRTWCETVLSPALIATPPAS
jgi:uncharacterized protein YbjT (DUF2867 family)